MKIAIKTLDNKAAGEASLNKDVFGLEVRKDILHRMVQYQRAKAQAGTHNTKTVGEISGTTKKPHKQKGTGSADKVFIFTSRFTDVVGENHTH